MSLFDIFRTPECNSDYYDGNYCRACQNSGYADYAAVPCECCNGEPEIKRRALQKETLAMESIAIDIKRIADSLEVMAGAKTINEIRHNIVPGSEVELFDGSKAVQVYCNVQKEENSSLAKAPEEGQAPSPD